MHQTMKPLVRLLWLYILMCMALYWISKTDFGKHNTRRLVPTSEDVPLTRDSLGMEFNLSQKTSLNETGSLIAAGATFSESHSPGQDMALVAACENVIISVGTFGWWGAFLRENKHGTVIYYSDKWETNNEESHIHEDFYPSDWIGIRYDMTDV